MPSPVYITQTQDEEQTILVKQVKDLKLSTILPTTLTLPTHRSTTSPSLQNSRPTSFVPTFSSAVTSNLLLAPSKCLPDVVGSTFSTNVGDATLSTNQWECYHAKYYYETVKHETPPSILAMAYGIINPITGLPLAYDGEPFSSYPKRNEFKVGNIHLRCEVIRRARLNPNWVGSRRGNDGLPKTGSWSKNKCEKWLSNNPINNVKDYQYILETVTKLIEVVSLSIPKQYTIDTGQIDNLQFNQNTPVLSTLVTLKIHLLL